MAYMFILPFGFDFETESINYILGFENPKNAGWFVSLQIALSRGPREAIKQF